MSEHPNPDHEVGLGGNTPHTVKYSDERSLEESWNAAFVPAPGHQPTPDDEPMPDGGLEVERAAPHYQPPEEGPDEAEPLLTDEGVDEELLEERLDLLDGVGDPAAIYDAQQEFSQFLSDLLEVAPVFREPEWGGRLVDEVRQAAAETAYQYGDPELARALEADADFIIDVAEALLEARKDQYELTPDGERHRSLDSDEAMIALSEEVASKRIEWHS